MFDARLICTSLIAVLLSPLSSAAAVQQAGQGNSNYFASEANDHPDPRFAMGLINSAVELAETCEPVSQGFLLLIAADAVSQVDSQKEKAYYAKSFEASRKLPRSMARQGLQEGLVSRMVNLNPDQAAELLERMDTPDIAPNPNLDVRSNLASAVVAKLLKRNTRGDAERAVGLIEYLGDTGQYPYRAAEEIIHFFHLQGEDWRGSDVLSEALNYLRNDDRFDDSTDQFVALIRTSQGEVSNTVLVRAIRAMIALAGGGEESGPEEESQASRTNASGRELVLQRRLPDIIGQLLAVARNLDPSTAEELEKRYTKLQQFSKGPTPNAEAASAGQVGNISEQPEEVPEEQTAAMTLQEVQGLSMKEPAKALARANEITLPGYRSQALAIVARSLATRDPRTATSLLRQAEALAAELDSTPAVTLEDLSKVMGVKVEAFARIAEAWGKLGNSGQASVLLGAAFEMAMEFLEKQAATRSAAPSGLDSSVGWLNRLAQVETDLNPMEAVRRAESISDPRLRAYVLLGVAREVLQRAGANPSALMRNDRSPGCGLARASPAPKARPLLLSNLAAAVTSSTERRCIGTLLPAVL